MTTTLRGQRKPPFNKGIAQAKKQEKREEAIKRQREYSALSPQERLIRLDERLGPGVGAIKERERLWALINEQKDAPPPKPKKPRAPRQKRKAKERRPQKKEKK